MRIFYNPYSNDLINTNNQSHVQYFHNNNMNLKFDEYIRGIIFNDNLYLRIYYPYDNIQELEYTEILKKSKLLLSQYANIIVQKIKNELNINIEKIHFNISNEDLKVILKTPYV